MVSSVVVSSVRGFAAMSGLVLGKYLSRMRVWSWQRLTEATPITTHDARINTAPGIIETNNELTKESDCAYVTAVKYYSWCNKILISSTYTKDPKVVIWNISPFLIIIKFYMLVSLLIHHLHISYYQCVDKKPTNQPNKIQQTNNLCSSHMRRKMSITTHTCTYTHTSMHTPLPQPPLHSTSSITIITKNVIWLQHTFKHCFHWKRTLNIAHWLQICY